MRKTVMVVDSDTTGEYLAALDRMRKALGKDCELIKIESRDPSEVLNEVLMLIGKRSKSNPLLLYSGQASFASLDNNLPCDSVNLDLLWKNISEVFGQQRNKQQEDMALFVFTGGLLTLVKKS